MSEFKFYPRPRCCPEPRCMPIFQTPPPHADEWESGKRDDPPGESWMCWGAMGQEIVFEYDGSRHANDTRACMYTPLKGIISYQENEGDWREIARCYGRALHRLVMLRDPERAEPGGENVESRDRSNDGRRA